MIIFQVEANVKPDQVDIFEDQIVKTANLIAQAEPNYTLQTYFDRETLKATFFNIAADNEALAHHFAEAGNDPEGQKRLMGSVEITAVKLYGQLSAELKEKLKAMGAQFFEPHSGIFDRTIVVKEAVAV